MSVRRALKREMRVALSRRAQPVWFRVVKWVTIMTLAVIFWRHPYFWRWVIGVFALALTLHLTWRWKTKAWTQPWWGWDDVETANKD